MFTLWWGLNIRDYGGEEGSQSSGLCRVSKKTKEQRIFKILIFILWQGQSWAPCSDFKWIINTPLQSVDTYKYFPKTWVHVVLPSSVLWYCWNNNFISLIIVCSGGKWFQQSRLSSRLEEWQVTWECSVKMLINSTVGLIMLLLSSVVWSGPGQC